ARQRHLLGGRPRRLNPGERQSRPRRRLPTAPVQDEGLHERREAGRFENGLSGKNSKLDNRSSNEVRVVKFQGWKIDISNWNFELPHSFELRISIFEFFRAACRLLPAACFSPPVDNAFSARILNTSARTRPHRLVAQDVGFSVRKPGFDSPWGYLF